MLQPLERPSQLKETISTFFCVICNFAIFGAIGYDCTYRPFPWLAVVAGLLFLGCPCAMLWLGDIIHRHYQGRVSYLIFFGLTLLPLIYGYLRGNPIHSA